MTLIQPHSTPSSPSEGNFSAVLDSAKTEGAAFFLDDLSLISVTGSDAEKFLQSQLSNDIAKLLESQSQLHAYCNPKGRILAILHLLKNPDEGYWMIVPGELADSLIKRLGIFVMRAKVAIQVEQGNAMLGMIGAKDQPETLNLFNFGTHIDRCFAIGHPTQLYEALDRFNATLDSDYWRLCDILSGHPQLFSQTVEKCIPQHLNMDLISGLSFSKGCYPGQEIIARLKYLGKSKYRLCHASVVSEQPIIPGDPIFEKHQTAQKSGLVVDAICTGKNTFQLSAMLKFTDGKHPQSCLYSDDGPELSLSTLPYRVPSE